MNCNAFRSYTGASLGVVVVLAMLASCTSGQSEHHDSDSATVTTEFHADNDIAMNVRSIIDAINVGQPLDSADYNYTGILTDGNGTPLYTDVQGAPGIWEIKVLTDKSAVIRNLYLGDLLPDELVQYVLETLAIEDIPLLEAEDGKKGLDNIAVYKSGATDIFIERQTAKAANGSEGPLLKIILRRTEIVPPDSISSSE